ncbi:MAG: CCA tRNA nucleotidyltransferase [Blautia sp.]|jgi:tRNA nucleotidyltransferase (CCA-adding enzyme)
MKLMIPAKVKGILEILNTHGYEAYVVGGCVRDSILDRKPDDWDITTSALPQEIKTLFRKTVDTGLAHGTVTVIQGGEGFEVTTYRVDGAYEDGRHPKEVTFTASLEEDLKRRDFTINAMAYHPKEGLVDLFGGMSDLQKKRIRCVGDAKERFSEDALRILRAVRFSAQLGFAIDEETKQALSALAPNLVHVSAERIQTELLKLLTSAHPDDLRTAWETGITKWFLPEFDAMMVTPQNTPHHMDTVGEHTLKSLSLVSPDKVLRLAMLLHDVGKPQVRTTDENGRDHFRGHGAAGEKLSGEILRRLKLDNDTIRKVCRLVKWHDYRIEPMEAPVRRAAAKIGPDLFPSYLKVQEADILAQSQYLREEKWERLQNVRRLYDKIVSEQQCVTLKEMKISGRDLIAMGAVPGPKIGEVLAELLDEVLEDSARNEEAYLKSRAAAKLKITIE